MKTETSCSTKNITTTSAPTPSYEYCSYGDGRRHCWGRLNYTIEAEKNTCSSPNKAKD